MNIRRTTLLGAVLLLLGSTAQAQDSGWVASFGLHVVNPKSDNGVLAGTLDAEIDDDLAPTIAFDYYFSPNWSLDILAAIPFEHTVSLDGAAAVDITHLPPTVSLQYHFAPEASLNPFVGVGLNYTLIYDEKARGPLAGTDVELDNSLGLAAQLGFEYRFDARWSLVADVRWMDIDTDVSVNGAEVGSAEVDPLAYGLMAAYRF